MNKATVLTSNTHVTLKEETKLALEELSEEMHEPVQDVLAKAVDAYWRQHVLEAHNAAYAALRADPQAWQAELDERKAWDVTLTDRPANGELQGNGPNDA
jgi:hypothetical protein